jgi:hypothetical protein
LRQAQSRGDDSGLLAAKAKGSKRETGGGGDRTGATTRLRRFRCGIGERSAHREPVEIRRGGSGAGDSGGGRLDRVFGLGPATKIYVAVEAVDMRKGFEGLYGLVRDQLRHDPLSGHLFLFTNKTKTRLKALVWDGSGLWVCAKRLEKGASAGRKSKARTASRYARRSWRCW